MAGRVRLPSPRRAAHGGAVYVLLVAFTLFILLPIGWMLTAALKPDTATIFTFPPEFFPTEHFEWGNFVAALTAEGEPYLRFVANTTFLVLMNMIGAVVSNSLIAYPFARLRFRGRNVLFIVLLGTLLLPAPVLLIPQFLLFFNIGWYGTFLPLIVPSFTGNAFFVFLLRQYMRTIPRELDEAARIDGAGYFTVYRRIILPLTTPALTVVAVFTFLGTWNDFFGPLIYLNDPEMYTVAVALATQVSRVGVEWNFLMASNLLAIIPPLVIYFLAQNKLIGGIASVGIRGVTGRVNGTIARITLVLLLGTSLVAGCAEAASPAPSAAGSPAASASPSDAAPTSSPASPSPVTGYANPVMVNDAPDPSVIRGDDGAFYAYTTQAYHDVEFTTLPILRSTDLVTWELVGDAFAGDARPPWIVPGSGNGDVWAPHIARVGGKYLLYYSASSASTLSFGIGVAVADSPTGPFRDLGEPLLTGPGFTTIDPFVLDDDGDLYLYWGSAGDPMWVQPLAPDGLSLTGERTKVLEPSRQPYESLIEGPWVVKQDGYYHLLYSGDNCCGANPNYAVLDARATSPLGPFERDPGNPVLAANDRFNAPGHNAVVTDDAGTSWMVYHAMDREEGSGLRFLMLDPIDWSSGWPTVNGGAGPATTSSDAPVIKAGG